MDDNLVLRWGLDGICFPRSNARVAISKHVAVQVDLDQIRRNARAISQQTGVPILAVIKADAYGLGAERVAKAIGDLVDRFCVFSLAEAVTARVWENTGKPAMTLGPDPGVGVEEYLQHHVRSAVWTIERATLMKSSRPILSVDTGMQRFSCPADQIDAVLATGACDEAFTHALRMNHVQELLSLVGGRGLRLHAAASALLDEPSARLDAVRPGIALYRGAARVSTHLVDVRDTHGPAGYTGFAARRHGIILAGYSHGLRPGPCMVNGSASRILEVGMQSAYVEAGENDRAGGEVILLGDAITEKALANAMQCSEQDALFRMAGTGERSYLQD